MGPGASLMGAILWITGIPSPSSCHFGNNLIWARPTTERTTEGMKDGRTENNLCCSLHPSSSNEKATKRYCSSLPSIAARLEHETLVALGAQGPFHASKPRTCTAATGTLTVCCVRDPPSISQKIEFLGGKDIIWLRTRTASVPSASAAEGFTFSPTCSCKAIV